MKARWIIAALLALLLLGGGIGYVTGVLPVWRSSDSQAQGPKSPLLIEEQKDQALGESGVESHRDLRFQNQANKPLTIHLLSTDCECASVRISVAPDEWKELDSPAFLKRADEPALAWQTLKRGGESFTIPPLSHGLIRVTWKAFRVGTSKIGITLQVEDGESNLAQRFTVPVNFVDSVWFCAEGKIDVKTIDLGHLKPGAEGTAKFLCCSTTRKRFSLYPAPPSDDPCIVYGTPQPLTREEVQALPRIEGADPVISGYRVTIKVRERAGGKRLDIGPFHRAIVYKSDVYPNQKVNTFVDGTVEGEVGLAASEGKDYVDLGLIIPTAPKPVTFTLESHDPQLRLKLDEQRSVDFLNVELLDGEEGKPAGKGKKWRVRVAFRTDSLFSGPIPNPNNTPYVTAGQCSVVFFVTRPGTTASPPLRLFVPVRGTVRGY